MLHPHRGAGGEEINLFFIFVPLLQDLLFEHRLKLSGRPDLNRRSHAPKACMLATTPRPVKLSAAITQPSVAKDGDENIVLIDYTPLIAILVKFPPWVNKRR